MKILALDYATNWCGCAILDCSEVVISESKFAPRKHAEILAPMTENLIKQSPFQWDSISGIAVTIGPCSFTGLRIGLSFAKGLSFALGIPIVPISTMHAIAKSYNIAGIATLHSHKNIIYWQACEQSKIQSGTVDDLIVSANPSEIIFGNAVEILKDEFQKHFSTENLYFDSETEKRNVISVGKIATENFDDLHVDNPNNLVPEYISKFSIREIS